MSILYVDSPVGRLALEAEDDTLTRVSWTTGRWAATAAPADDETPAPVLREAARQLDRYFARKLERFDLPLAARGTPFQKSVWKRMSDIPFGATETYGQMAAALGSGPRAVGMACGRNPIPIIVPCHRVLGSGGKGGGFSGGRGLPTKQELLAHEGVVLL
ncbi:MAG: methylated-DNA--[protein]-cysteine S-methyltransferase [Proteobacteria bacterium]|nr:methylated-DNA--[protein]-cysteine S-methyltransferase [Pseudomonadota bacterium]